MSAEKYLEYIGTPWGRLFYKLLFAQAGELKNKTVLDFGSGLGFTANHYAADNDVTAVEPDPEMIKEGFRENYYRQICGGADSLADEPDRKYDVIFCHNVLEYVNDDERKKIISEFVRLLKDDGFISIVKHNKVGKIMQKAVFEYRLEEAKSLLRGEDTASELFGTIREYEDDEPEKLSENKLVTVQKMGLRIFYGLQDNELKRSSEWVREMLETERLAEGKKEFYDVAFFHHIILRKSGHDSGNKAVRKEKKAVRTLYVSDLDGTLLDGRAKLKDRAAELIKRLSEQGVLFTYATARRYVSAGPIMQKAGISVPVITQNGVAIVKGDTGEMIALNGFEPESLEEAKQMIMQYGETPLVYAFIDSEQRVSYLSHDTERIKSYINDRKGDSTLRPCDSYEQLFEGNIYYFTFINAIIPEKTLNGVFSAEKGFSVNGQMDTYHEDEFWYEVFSVKASKANAALQLKEMLGADELVCFGDNINDISMFKAADRCYAVSNALDELKNIASGVIGSNVCLSVPAFIEKEQRQRFEHKKSKCTINLPDNERFAKAVELAKKRETTNIGTLNEKCIHSTLKYYYSEGMDHEAKIGDFYADIVTESGIIEIQSANFSRLNKKLETMLNACHVTVVYPLERRVKCISADEKSGEVLNIGQFRTTSSNTKLFLELYRIKSFLTDPNLTICVAELETEKVNFVDPKTGRRRGRGKYVKTPLRLIREIMLEEPSDYKIFLPDGLPEKFTAKQFQQLVKATDAKLMLEILSYMGIAEKCGKKGNADLFKVCGVPLV